MGFHFYDRYSLLHFAVGIIAYYWSISWWVLFIIHSLFEYVENTTWGIHFINNWFTIWPGGKDHPDAIINSIGDTFFSLLGWFFTSYST